MDNDTISLKGQVFNTLVAISEEEQRIGLMYQKWPPPIMVFPYKRAGQRKFWMHNTFVPLDIIFCKSNQIIGIFTGEPLSTKLIGPSEPSDLVIELPAGKAASLGLGIGDYVGFSPTKLTLAGLQDRGISV